MRDSEHLLQALVSLSFGLLAGVLGYQHHVLGHPVWAVWVFAPIVALFVGIAGAFVVRWWRAT